MGFPPILSALQTFQICIFNTKNSKLTFSNGSQLMGKRFMANLHASLDSICKSRISNISTRCQNWESHSTAFDPELRNEFKNFAIFGGLFHNFWSELRNELNFFPSSGGPFHNFWSWTQKWIQKCLQSFGVSIPQLLILNSEMNSKFFQSWGVHSTTFDPELRNEFKNIFKSWRDPFQNFWPWTQKLKFGIDIFYGVSSNIKCITDISNLHFQYKKRVN